MWKPQVDGVCLPLSSPTSSFETRSVTDLSAFAQGSDTCRCAWLLCGLWGSELRSLCLRTSTSSPSLCTVVPDTRNAVPPNLCPPNARLSAKGFVPVFHCRLHLLPHILSALGCSRHSQQKRLTEMGLEEEGSVTPSFIHSTHSLEQSSGC